MRSEKPCKLRAPAPCPRLPVLTVCSSAKGCSRGPAGSAARHLCKGWYLPDLTTAQAELDSLDFIEDLKIASGPLISVLTATSLHGGLVDAWPMEQASAKAVVEQLLGRWQRDGLPDYAQFDNGTQLPGEPTNGPTPLAGSVVFAWPCTSFPDSPPRVSMGFRTSSRVCNGLWQAKVWQRYQVEDLPTLQALSAQYVMAHRARTVRRREQPAGAPGVSRSLQVRSERPAGREHDLSAPQ